MAKDDSAAQKPAQAAPPPPPPPPPVNPPIQTADHLANLMQKGAGPTAPPSSPSTAHLANRIELDEKAIGGRLTQEPTPAPRKSE